MLQQLLPILLLAGIFGLYTLKCIVVYLWDESMRIAAEAHHPDDLEDYIYRITPTETPFTNLLKDPQ